MISPNASQMIIPSVTPAQEDDAHPGHDGAPGDVRRGTIFAGGGARRRSQREAAGQHPQQAANDRHGDPGPERAEIAPPASAMKPASPEPPRRLTPQKPATFSSTSTATASRTKRTSVPQPGGAEPLSAAASNAAATASQVPEIERRESTIPAAHNNRPPTKSQPDARLVKKAAAIGVTASRWWPRGHPCR